MARFYLILSIMGREIHFPVDLPDGTDLESLRGRIQGEIATTPPAPPAPVDPIEAAIAELWKGFKNPAAEGVVWRRYVLHDALVEFPTPRFAEPSSDVRFAGSREDVRATLRSWGGVWDSDKLFDLAVKTAELRRRMKEEQQTLERFTAPLSRTRRAAIVRAESTDDVFIPYCHYRGLHGAIVRKDALEGHFDALYDRATRVLWFNAPRGRAVRIERETDTHVFFVREG